MILYCNGWCVFVLSCVFYSIYFLLERTNVKKSTHYQLVPWSKCFECKTVLFFKQTILLKINIRFFTVWKTWHLNIIEIQKYLFFDWKNKKKNIIKQNDYTVASIKSTRLQTPCHEDIIWGCNSKYTSRFSCPHFFIQLVGGH